VQYTVSMKTANRKIAKKDIRYDTPIGLVEVAYGFETGFPPNTKFGDVVKKVSPAAAKVLNL